MSDLPRLLLCSFEALPGPNGTSRRIAGYLPGLVDRFAVDILSPAPAEPAHHPLPGAARRLPISVGNGDHAAKVEAFDRAVRRQLEAEEYAVVHAFDPGASKALCELRDRRGFRLVYEAHDLPSRECLMHADRVIAGSEVTRSFLQGLGVPEERIEVIRAPVQLDAFASASTAVPSRRTLHVLYLGSQADWQGIPVLLQALRIALDAKVALQLSLVGPFHPVHKPVLEALVEELELGEHVSFLPAVPHEELPGVLASADVFAVPLEDVERNRVVGGPLSKCADYLAAGRPIVASDLPLTRELLPPEASLFHPPGDSEALAAQLKALAGDLRQRLRMGFAARETARRFHDAKAARRHLKSLYAALENAADEILQADDAIESYEIIPPRLDPWFAQLVHGYCPPEGAPSPLPTAPTNFPGREGPPPATVQPSAGSNPSFPTRSGGG